MITCVVDYTIDPAKTAEFERFARAWIGLVNNHRWRILIVIGWCAIVCSASEGFTKDSPEGIRWTMSKLLPERPS